MCPLSNGSGMSQHCSSTVQPGFSLRFSRNWAIALGFLLIVTMMITGCLSVGPMPTLTPSPIPSTPSPTFAFPTKNPSVTFTPELEPTSTQDLMSGLGSVLYFDDFDQNLGWEIGQSEIGGASLISGRLSLAVHQANSYYFVQSPAPAMASFFLEVNMRSELCNSGDEFGVMYRINSLKEHYRFALTCEGDARVSLLLESGEIALIPITQTYAAFPGLLVENQIGVWADRNSFRFFINGLEVFSVHDNTLDVGDFALFVRSRRNGQTTASFDKLIMRALLPTPTPTFTATTTAQP